MVVAACILRKPCAYFFFKCRCNSQAWTYTKTLSVTAVMACTLRDHKKKRFYCFVLKVFYVELLPSLPITAQDDKVFSLVQDTIFT